MIKTIIFDIGGVVVKSNFEAMYSNFAKRIGLSPEFVIKHHNERTHDFLLGNITLEQFWKDMIDAGANPKLDLENIWVEEGIKNREMNDGLLSIIKKLKEKYSVGVLTNITPFRLILDNKISLYSYFDYAVLSCKEHIKKPDHKFYRLALKIASTKPEESVFIDDKKSCISPAEEIGMKTILYEYPDNAKLLEDLKQLGVSI